MRLPSLRRAPRRSVDIDPVQLTVLHALLKRGPMPLRVLYAEVILERTLPREMFDSAMADLVRQEVAAAGFIEETGAPGLLLTPFGKRLKGKLPRESGAALRVYL